MGPLALTYRVLDLLRAALTRLRGVLCARAPGQAGCSVAQHARPMRLSFHVPWYQRSGQPSLLRWLLVLTWSVGGSVSYVQTSSAEPWAALASAEPWCNAANFRPWSPGRWPVLGPGAVGRRPCCAQAPPPPGKSLSSESGCGVRAPGYCQLLS